MYADATFVVDDDTGATAVVLLYKPDARAT